MAVLLLNLRDVPDDEAEDVRALLDRHAIAFYETEPNRWGISAGAIWIADDNDAAQAKELLAMYQLERKTLARADHEKAIRDGTLESFGSQLRRRPLQLLVILAGIAILVGLSLWPLLLAAR
jgi:hypothetical protein